MSTAHLTKRLVALALVALLGLSHACSEPAPAPDGPAPAGPQGAPPAGGAAAPAGERAAASRAAFLAVYPVFMHPRCVNCHPAGDAPLQGEDSRLHAQGVKRGADGRGKFALKCASCHLERNQPGENMPPGNPNWHLPPADMPMVFQGRSAAELARQLKDPAQTGGRTLEQLHEHLAQDSLVLGCWTPGDGRAPPPLPHAELARRFREWLETGAAIPE